MPRIEFDESARLPHKGTELQSVREYLQLVWNQWLKGSSSHIPVPEAKREAVIWAIEHDAVMSIEVIDDPEAWSDEWSTMTYMLNFPDDKTAVEWVLRFGGQF